MKNKITDVQSHLREEKCDGWLLYDFQRMNPLARAFLELPDDLLTSRRFFYWIPKQGVPIKIVHAIEQGVLDHLPGEAIVYLKWQEFEESLAYILKGMHTVAMEFSEHCSLPYVSKVDAGLIDLIRSFSVKVVSSAGFLQYYTCVLDEEQIAMHIEAADFLAQTAEETWEKIAHALSHNQPIDEYAVAQFIQARITGHGYINEDHPICAVNEHSADPHFAPKKNAVRRIEKGDFILIDLWCKKNHPKGVYGDITRVAYAGPRPPTKHQEIFHIVRQAQKAATDYVVTQYANKKYPKGCEVDEVCRNVIEKAGYGAYFTHRTGHNIYTKDHGPGAHIDSLETRDFRHLIPRTCFSIEPGIYLPGEFGIRLEYDLLTINADTVRITGGTQEEITSLL
jgi:Xaa-Pro dipeptidase